MFVCNILEGWSGDNLSTGMKLNTSFSCMAYRQQQLTPETKNTKSLHAHAIPRSQGSLLITHDQPILHGQILKAHMELDEGGFCRNRLSRSYRALSEWRASESEQFRNCYALLHLFDKLSFMGNQFPKSVLGSCHW